MVTEKFTNKLIYRQVHLQTANFKIIFRRHDIVAYQRENCFSASEAYWIIFQQTNL